MLYRRVGDSGLIVSELALGTWRTYNSRISDAEVRAAIVYAHHRGVTLFDTANVYQHGAVEQLLGSALRASPRDSYVLCTKVGYPMSGDPDNSGLSRKHIVEQCNASLRRLGVDHIDLYVCHRPDPLTSLEETLGVLDDLVAAGKILHAGLSSYPAAQLSAADELTHRLGLNRIVCHQPQYSLLVREAEAGVLELARRLGMGTIAWAPLAQGVLTGKYQAGQLPPSETRGANRGYERFMRGLLTDDAVRRVQRLAPIATELGVTLAQLALAWVLRREEISSAIVGVSRAGQLDELLTATRVRISPDALDAIDAAMAEPGTAQATPRRSR
ncbi:MAG TPA: aldo/keto reductase [Solirubrobacteraceae bacterium]|nr:aldo/keto reductase [Solirubrobacteraceae bacterium]